MDKIQMTVNYLQGINAGFTRKEAIEMVAMECGTHVQDCMRWVYNQLHQIEEGSLEQRARTAATCLVYGCLNFDALNTQEREAMYKYLDSIEPYFSK